MSNIISHETATIHYVDFNAGTEIKNIKIVKEDDFVFCDAGSIIRALELKDHKSGKYKTYHYIRGLIRTNPEEVYKVNKEEKPDFFTEEELEDARYKEKYFITEHGLLFLLMKMNNKKAKEFQRWIVKDVLESIKRFGRYDPENCSLEDLRPKMKNSEEEALQLSKKNSVFVEAAHVFREYYELAKDVIGLDAQSAKLRANQFAVTQLGIDILGGLGVKMISSRQERLYNTSDLFLPFQLGGARGNIVLMHMGLQTRERDHRGTKWLYSLTEEGKKWARYTDVPRVTRSDGTITKQILWYESLRGEIEKYLNEEDDAADIDTKVRLLD